MNAPLTNTRERQITPRQHLTGTLNQIERMTKAVQYLDHCCHMSEHMTACIEDIQGQVSKEIDSAHQYLEAMRPTQR